MGRAVGIDLGTTTSAVAIIGSDGIPTILPNREGERLTPSVVLYQGDNALVGSSAKQSVVDSPNDIVQFVKRHMGEPDWIFTTSEGHRLEAEMISAAILQRLKDDAEMALGEPVTDAVISVPAYFMDAARKATQDAGEIVGLNVLGLINEPTAAAVSYSLRTGRQGTVLVYDLGGGTFDVTVMDVVGKDFRVRATHGDRNLGGLQWDNELVGLLMNRAGVDIDSAIEPAHRSELREKAERAKHVLTSSTEARVPLRVRGRQDVVRVTRAEFEAQTRSLLARTRTGVEIALADAGLSLRQIDHVVLAGGSTRMPMVRDMVSALVGQTVLPTGNPDEAVALGAAVQAAVLAEAANRRSEKAADKGQRPEIAIRDVTAHGLGVISLDPATGRHRNHVLLRSNSPIPGSGERRFVTAASGQSRVLLRITEGDDEDVDYVQIVGRARIVIPENTGRTTLRIVISFSADAVVFAEVFDDLGAKIGDLEIERRGNLTREQIVDAATALRRVQVS